MFRVSSHFKAERARAPRWPSSTQRVRAEFEKMIFTMNSERTLLIADLSSHLTLLTHTHEIRQKLRVCWEHPRSSNKITCGYKVWNCLDWVSQCLNRVSGPERMGGEEETAAWLLSHRLSVSTRLNSVKHCDIFRLGESLQRVEI